MYPMIQKDLKDGKCLLEWDFSKGQAPVPLLKDLYSNKLTFSVKEQKIKQEAQAKIEDEQKKNEIESEKRRIEEEKFKLEQAELKRLAEEKLKQIEKLRTIIKPEIKSPKIFVLSPII